MTAPERKPPRNSKSDLYEAALAAVKDREDAALSRPRGRSKSRFPWVAVLLPLILAAGALLLLRPVWLVGPTNPSHESPAVAAASLRLTLLRERQHVLDYLRSNGRLPRTLAEAGVTASDIRYEAQGDNAFRLSANAGDSLIVLSSSDSMRVFLGESLRAIRNRGRP